MKKSLSRLITLFFIIPVMQPAQAGTDTTKTVIENWLTAGPQRVLLPVYANEKDLHGKTFKLEGLLKFNQKTVEYPEEDRQFLEGIEWVVQKTDKQGNLKPFDNPEGTNIYWQAAWIHVPEFVKLNITITTGRPFELYLDKEKKLLSYKFAKNDNEKLPEKDKTFSLEPGRHLLVVKSLFKNDTALNARTVKVTYTVKNEVNNPPEFNTSPKTFMDIDHLLHGRHLTSVSVSPNGSYYMLRFSQVFPPDGKSERWTEIYDKETGKLIKSFRYSDVNNIRWVPGDNSISYTAERGGKKCFLLMDLKTLNEREVARLPEKSGGYTWAKTGDFIVYNVSDKLKRDKSGVYKIEGMPDRWPWYRKRTRLYMLRLSDGYSVPLTHGHLTCQLQDISHNGKFILFSQSVPQYEERPYYRQYMMQMDLTTLETDTLWVQNFSGSAHYSPDDNQLVVTGSPAMFNNAGVNLKKAKIPNDYDKQAYIYDIKTGVLKPITKTFNPAVQRVVWNQEDNNIYILAENRTYRNIWRYNTEAETFDSLPVKVDLVNNFSVSHTNHTLVYSGSSISYPATAWMMDLNNNDSKLICDSEKTFFKDVTFGKTEEWTFKNKRGLTIDGRIYYPPGFNPAKKYPLIVYYYGGTSPTSRSFRGRYPKNLFAAHGYVVYVLQPSGATGYGQNFSALHVNGWGTYNASDIVEGTEKFLKAHPFINKDAVGCMGASYGGYMTMYLQTQTDIFSAAIAHAGISSISSYWGEGYWGYLYSSTASANSFPWNNKKLYVDHSSLFNADRINTPLLLLHGTSDTNVPTGESIQLYTALKLLGKPVELVEIEGENHHITNYKKRIRWQKTILAWFDKYLKNSPGWWKSLYPDKNL